MRESCQCGGFIAALSYRRVRDWRTNHMHEGRPAPEPQKQGSFSTVEQAHEPQHMPGGSNAPVIAAKAGFTA